MAVATVRPLGLVVWLSEDTHLHPEEGNTGEQVHRGLEVLQPLGAAGREVVLLAAGG